MGYLKVLKDKKKEEKQVRDAQMRGLGGERVTRDRDRGRPA